jgi:hypothetical protein
MADEISRAEANAADARKRDVEKIEQSQSPDVGEGKKPGQPMDPAHRARVERQLLRKLDARCSLFVLIYIVSR